MNELITYMSHLWLEIESDTVTVGVNEDGADELEEITSIRLPREGEKVSADEICGEIEGPSGSINVYSPVNGKIVEINGALLDDPQVLFEDPEVEGWLIRVQANDEDDLRELVRGSTSDDEDDVDEDEEIEEDEE